MSRLEADSIYNTPHQYYLVETSTKRWELLKCLKREDIISFDTETTGLDTQTAELVSMQFCWAPHTAYCVLFPNDRQKTIDILREFDAIFSNSNIELVGSNLKYEFNMLRMYGIEIKCRLFDTMIASYCIRTDGNHGMDDLAQKYLYYDPLPISWLIDPKGTEQITTREAPVQKLVEYSCEDVDVCLQLRSELIHLMDEQS